MPYVLIDHRGRSFWMGGKFVKNQGWYWMRSPQASRMQFGEFTPGEPNSLFGSRSESCVILGANLMWWDDPCDMQNPVIDTICEKQLGQMGMA